MKISVDDTRCSGHGRCYALAPELFDCDDEGFNSARGSTVEVNTEQYGSAMLAVETCPEQALVVTDDK